MTLMELYYGLKSGEIELRHGICAAIRQNIENSLSDEFSDVMSERQNFLGNWFYGCLMLPDAGHFTPERETFLLLFAAYKGEL